MARPERFSKESASASAGRRTLDTLCTPLSVVQRRSEDERASAMYIHHAQTDLDVLREAAATLHPGHTWAGHRGRLWLWHRDIELRSGRQASGRQEVRTAQVGQDPGRKSRTQPRIPGNQPRSSAQGRGPGDRCMGAGGRQAGQQRRPLTFVAQRCVAASVTWFLHGGVVRRASLIIYSSLRSSVHPSRRGSSLWVVGHTPSSHPPLCRGRPQVRCKCRRRRLALTDCYMLHCSALLRLLQD